MDYSKMKKAQLIEEVEALQVKIAELKRAEAERQRAEEELRTQRDKLKGIIASLADGLDIVSQDYRVRFQNKTLRDRFGDLTGELCYEGYMARETPCEPCPMVKAIATGSTQGVELTGADGREYEVTSTPFQDIDGETKVIEIVRDITEHKQTEEALRRAEAETRRRLKEQIALREAGAIITSTLDPTEVLSRIAEQMGLAVDATSAYISSYEPMKMTATVLAEYISPQACPQEQVSDLGATYVEDAGIEWLEMMQAGQRDVSYIGNSDLPESERAHMQQFGAKTILYVPLLIKGKLIGYVEIWESRRRREFTSEEIALCRGIAQQAAIALENAQLYEQAQQEIAERKRTAESLRESEEKYRNLVERANDGICIIQDAIVKYANPRWAAMWGGTVEELIGTPFTDYIHPDELSKVVDRYERRMAGEEVPPIYETVLRRKDGSKVYVELNAGVIVYQGKPADLVFVRDITERVQAERLLRALNQAGRAMGKAMTPEEIFTTVAEEFKQIGSSCVVFLTDESQKGLLPKYFSYEAKAIKALEKLTGLNTEEFPPIPIEAVDVYREVVWERKIVFVENVEETLRQLLPELLKKFNGPIAKILKVSRSIAAPLIVEDEVIGVLSVQSDDLTEEDISAITAFTHQMAAAWRKASLLQDLQRSLAEREQAQEELQRTTETLRKTLGATIQAMASTVETRDPYTAGHQRRVADLARAIADEMGLSKEQTNGIRMAGLIHDLGKITIPAEILSKPTQLNEFEWGIIQAHPQVGYDLLKTVDFTWPVAQIVLQHHERMDGSGYPQGLSGEEIMLEARILAVADVVEAMASYRPYRPARGIDEALEEISQNKDVLYDAEVVDACLKLFTEKGFEFRKSSTRS